MSTLSDQLQQAAEVYRERGWTAMPLENDANNFPKKPFIPNWQTYTPYNKPFSDFEWQRATGLGLVLGKNSGGLCVLDVDDPELGRLACQAWPTTRQVQTIRKRAHLYFIEREQTDSTAQTISFNGASVKVELKSKGTQVAAPPTPGYLRLNNARPETVESITVVWHEMIRRLSLDAATPIQAERTVTQPWLGHVPKDNRNNTLYFEAHKLREAGMSLELALDHLRHRWETVYEAGEMDWREVERTVQSAYRKPVAEAASGRDSYRLWFGWDSSDADGTK